MTTHTYEAPTIRKYWVDKIINEFEIASRAYPQMRSAHEGYAIMLEEVDELWDEIKLHPPGVITNNMQEEAVQVAVMAIRLLVDILTDDNQWEAIVNASK